MILQALAATNFLLSAYDAYLTNRRMKAFGSNIELNGLIKYLSTPLGPELASVIGVLGPCVGWTFILCYFNLPVALALLVGFGVKRFEIQIASRVYERSTLQIQKMMKEFRSANGATLPPGESTPSADRENLKEGK